jgi:DNA-binding NarL/FixJ family response regulator
VAALLAEGLSNGEIARRLYISTKTASVYVSNILAKLDMTSRTEVAAWPSAPAWYRARLRRMAGCDFCCCCDMR